MRPLPPSIYKALISAQRTKGKGEERIAFDPNWNESKDRKCSKLTNSVAAWYFCSQLSQNSAVKINRDNETFSGEKKNMHVFMCTLLCMYISICMYIYVHTLCMSLYVCLYIYINMNEKTRIRVLRRWHRCADHHWSKWWDVDKRTAGLKGLWEPTSPC